jgi:mRNA interferase MazF
MTVPMLRGEVWRVEFEPSIGTEIKKMRPAVIVSNDAANRNLPRVMAMPLTSNTDRVYPGEAAVTVDGRRSKAMADQIMAADKRRLKTRLGALSRADMLAVEDAIKLHLGLGR